MPGAKIPLDFDTVSKPQGLTIASLGKVTLMFRIGEFAQIAQVSTRQLRHYDQLGLLRPLTTDAVTGYRYYSMRQLPRLNAILALKELGLTLDQIGSQLENEITASELRGMLTMKRAQIEQLLHEEELQA